MSKYYQREVDELVSLWITRSITQRYRISIFLKYTKLNLRFLALFCDTAHKIIFNSSVFNSGIIDPLDKIKTISITAEMLEKNLYQSQDSTIQKIFGKIDLPTVA